MSSDQSTTPEAGQSTGLSVAAGSALNAALQLKADMFDYLCWLEDFCEFRQAALDGKAGDYLVMASDGTTCWGKTYADAVRVAMEHDKELHDAAPSLDEEIARQANAGTLNAAMREPNGGDERRSPERPTAPSVPHTTENPQR